MNRGSGFKRPVVERAPRSPVTPLVECRGVYAPSVGLVLAQPKETILRSRRYRMWVATQWPCDICGVTGFGQCAHENLGKSLQGKVCDSRTFNACGPHWGLPGCHWAFDNYVDISRDEARELGARLSARMRERAELAGWSFTRFAILPPAKVPA
jgi:hypothetical protein